MAPREIIPKAMKGVILENRPLAPLTTWKIGGPAKYLAAAAGLEEVFALMALAQERGWPLFFLGRGSNLLIADAGLPGLTLHLARSLQILARQGDTLRAGAGVSLPRLARTAAALGFSGFEFLAGIPGSVGAAVRLNAGADGRDLAAVLNRVWVATPKLAAPGISGRGTGAGLSFLPAPLFPPLAGGGGGVSPEHPGPAGGGAAAPGGIADGPPGPAARQLPQLRQRL